MRQARWGGEEEEEKEDEVLVGMGDDTIQGKLSE